MKRTIKLTQVLLTYPDPRLVPRPVWIFVNGPGNKASPGPTPEGHGDIAKD